MTPGRVLLHSSVLVLVLARVTCCVASLSAQESISSSTPSSTSASSDTSFQDANWTFINSTPAHSLGDDEDTYRVGYDGEWSPAEGHPEAKMSQTCRFALAQMLGNSALCDPSEVMETCSPSLLSLAEWQVLCLSGLFSDSAHQVLSPEDPGEVVATWGATSLSPPSYMQRFGWIGAVLTQSVDDREAEYNRSYSSAALGPVLRAVVERAGKEPHLKGIIHHFLNLWITEVARHPDPFPKELMARLVLGGLALRSISPKTSMFSKLRSSPLGSCSPGSGSGRSKVGGSPSREVGGTDGSPGRDVVRRELQQLQSMVVRLPFRPGTTLGAGYSREFGFVGNTPVWNIGTLPKITFDATDYAQFTTGAQDSACWYINPADWLAGAGGAGLDGDGFFQTSTGSWFLGIMPNRTECVAMHTKRVFQTGAELTSIQLPTLPVLNDNATALLRTQGVGAFERRYGAYFVLGFLTQREVSILCSVYPTSPEFRWKAAGRTAGPFQTFTAAMQNMWAGAQDAQVDYKCFIKNSPRCNSSTPIIQLLGCASNASVLAAPSEPYQVLLLPFTALPSFREISFQAVPPSLTVPWANLDASMLSVLLKHWMRTTWSSLATCTLTSNVAPQFVRSTCEVAFQDLTNVFSALASNRTFIAENAMELYDSANTSSMYWNYKPASTRCADGILQCGWSLSLPRRPNGTLIGMLKTYPGILGFMRTHYNHWGLTFNQHWAGDMLNIGRPLWPWVGGLPNDTQLELVAQMALSRRADIAQYSALFGLHYALHYLTTVSSPSAEGCTTFSTSSAPWVDVASLQPHDVRCGQDQFLQRVAFLSPNSTSLQILYDCCFVGPISRPALRSGTMTTASLSFDQTNILTLSRHIMDCNGFQLGRLQGFNLVVNGTVAYFNYTCLRPPGPLNLSWPYLNLPNQWPPYQRDGNQVLATLWNLGMSEMKCNWFEFMTGLQLVRSSGMMNWRWGCSSESMPYPLF